MNSIDYSKLVQSYCYDLNYIADILAKFSGTYSVLINSADTFNKIALAKKNDVKDAIDRADKLGKIIDKLIENISIQANLYINYSGIKNDYIINNLSLNEIIKSEIKHNIKLDENEENQN